MPPVRRARRPPPATVALIAFGDSKVEVIKEIRAITSLGLKEAKDLVEDTPSIVKEDVSWFEAEAIQAALENVGAKSPSSRVARAATASSGPCPQDAPMQTEVIVGRAGRPSCVGATASFPSWSLPRPGKSRSSPDKLDQGVDLVIEGERNRAEDFALCAGVGLIVHRVSTGVGGGRG